MEKQSLHRLTDRVWYMDPTIETDRPSLGYVIGDNFSIMIDAGNSPAHVELFYKLLDENKLPRPSFCLITHWHWDHTYGICGLGIPSICSEATAERLKAHLHSDYTHTEDPCILAEYANTEKIKVSIPEITFNEKLSLDLGGVTAEAIFAGGPHSSDSSLFYIKEEGVLFAGDSSSGNFDLPNIPYDIPLLNEHEELLRAIPFTKYLHAHWPVMTRDEVFEFTAKGRRLGYYTF